MAVGLDESRQDAAVADVDGRGVGADEPGDFGAVTDGDDPPVGDRECLRGGPLFVDGEQVSGDDEVCGGHEHGY